MVRFTLDTMPPALPDFSKMDYELNLFEIIQRSPIPKEDEENNVRISSKWIPKSYDHAILSLELSNQTRRYYQNGEGDTRYSKSKRSYIVRCCIHSGHAIFQHNEFIKNFVDEFYDKTIKSQSFEEKEMFYPSNPTYVLDDHLLQLGEVRKIYISTKTLNWIDTNKQIFNMNRHELAFLLFCIGALNIPNIENVYSDYIIKDLKRVLVLCSEHILNRRLDVENYYKKQENKGKNLFDIMTT